MTPEKREIDHKWYITGECFVDADQHILINNSSSSPRLGGLPWRLLECLMSQPNIIVQYQTISQYVWNDSEHISAHIAQILLRIKHYCRDIGVEDKEFNEAFEHIRGEGIRFNPPFKGTTDITRTSAKEEAFAMANNVFYFTETCYMLTDRQVLVNNDKTTSRIPELPWRLLRCFLLSPRVIIPFKDLSFAVWGDYVHTAQDIATVMHRIKKYFSEVEVTRDELYHMFITYRGQGICFTPLTGIACYDPI